ncbi:MAG: ABC transporter permease [Terracidiphilus sp.]|jgi:predicted permease
MFNDLRIRLRSFFRKAAAEAELKDELRFHLDNEAEKYKRTGMADEEAKRCARLAFGGEEQVKQDCRDARGTRMAETVIQDIRYALRSMRKNPGFFAIAALTLALGIGSSIAVFSLVNAILLKPLPYPNAGQVVMIWRQGPLAGIGDMPFSPGEYCILARSETVFQNLGAFKKDSFNLTGVSDPELLEGVRVTAGFFPTLGVAPALGRTFTEEEDHAGRELVVVLSNRLWRTRFGADPGIVGKTVHLNGSSYSVIGVMPPNFLFPNQEGIPPILDLPRETQLWVPLALPANPRGANELGVIGQLRTGVSLTGVEQDLENFEAVRERQIPQEKNWSSHAVPLMRQTASDARLPLLLLLGAVSVVLLIACANVAGLTLNRSLGRRRELTLRGALGAVRSRIVQQLMTESLILAFIGGGLGILLAELSLLMVKHFASGAIPHLHETGLDLRVITFAVGVTLATGLLFGLAPAMGATRMNMVEALKAGGQRSGGSATAPKMRNALIIVQVAMAMVLVIAAGLLVRTFYSMLRADAGFDATRVVTFELPLPTPKYADTARMADLYLQVLLRLQSIPSVRGAGFASVVPMGGAPDGTVIRMPEHPSANSSEKPFANYAFISPGYFAAIAAPLLRGRDINDADTLNAVPVTIINAAMARKFFPGEDPIGKQVGVGMTRIPVRIIVGVVADTKQASLREQPDPEMFVPATQNEIKVWPSMQTMQFAVRTRIDDASIAESVRQAVHTVDPDLPVAKFSTLTTLVNTSMTADRFSVILVGALGMLALILASVGMYGVISYSVLQRMPEIGLRMALGAKRSQVFAMILRNGGRLAIAGVTIGLIAALAATRLMARFLFGVQPTDPFTFAVVSFLLILVALLASYLPARRAMKLDPMIILRYE